MAQSRSARRIPGTTEHDLYTTRQPSASCATGTSAGCCTLLQRFRDGLPLRASAALAQASAPDHAAAGLWVWRPVTLPLPAGVATQIAADLQRTRVGADCWQAASSPSPLRFGRWALGNGCDPSFEARALGPMWEYWKKDALGQWFELAFSLWPRPATAGASDDSAISRITPWDPRARSAGRERPASRWALPPSLVMDRLESSRAGALAGGDLQMPSARAGRPGASRGGARHCLITLMAAIDAANPLAAYAACTGFWLWDTTRCSTADVTHWPL